MEEVEVEHRMDAEWRNVQMILGLGLMVSVYLSFLVLPGSQSGRSAASANWFISRVTTLVVVVYLLFILDSLTHWHGDVVFLDHGTLG